MRKPSLAQCVLTRIQEDITRGNIKDGEIITERILEQRYGVSRTPIKEALKLLEAEGWVEITPRQETRVIPFGIAEIQETLSIRIAMEGIAIKLCMQHMNDDLRLEFGQLLRELEDLGEKIDVAAPDTLDVYNGLDNRFHSMLYRYSENRTLRGFHNSLRSLFRRTYYNIPLDIQRIRNGSDELIMVIRCMLDNDVLLAEVQITKHIINSIDQKINFLKIGLKPTENKVSS